MYYVVQREAFEAYQGTRAWEISKSYLNTVLIFHHDFHLKIVKILKNASL